MKRPMMAAVLAGVMVLGMLGMMAFFLGGCASTTVPTQGITVVQHFATSAETILVGFRDSAQQAGNTAQVAKYNDIIGYIDDAQAVLLLAGGDPSKVQAAVVDLVGKIKIKDPVVAALVQVAAQEILGVIFPQPVATTAKAPAKSP